MALKFKKEQHKLISEAVKCYIKHLEIIQYDKFDYLGELRNFLGKLLRENDWSYILWASPKNDIAGKIKILKSSCTDFPRNSKWALYRNGKLCLSSIFKSKELNLVEILIELKTVPQQIPVNDQTSKLMLCLKNNEFIEIETTPSIVVALKELESIVKDSTFTQRITPSLIMLDSVQFYLENKQNDQCITHQLLKIREHLIFESYGIKPEYIKRKIIPYDENEDPNTIKLKISNDSLMLLENILSEYCQIAEQYLPPEQIDYDKLDKAKLLTEKFRQSIK